MARRIRRNRPTTWLAIAALAGALFMTFALPGPWADARGQETGATQTSREGPVTVAVTWAGPIAGPSFSVVLDTHSVDLDRYDLLTLALLRNDQGLEVGASAWNAPLGGHHREGTLAFPETSADGIALIGPETSALELVIRDVGGVQERAFRWSWE